MSLDPFPFGGLPPLSPVVLWGVFLAVSVGFAAISWVLHFHWKAYGMGRRAVTVAETVYFVGAMGMLASALVSAIAY